VFDLPGDAGGNDGRVASRGLAIYVFAFVP
jgi:hypothetical protein